MGKETSDFRYNTGNTKVPWAAVGENYNAQDVMEFVKFLMNGKGKEYSAALKEVGAAVAKLSKVSTPPGKLSMGDKVAEVEKMALPPCHSLFQFYVADGKLSCQLYQRSADVFLGVPFNIASYALLTMMIAQVCGLQPGEFVHTTGDTHIYTNHFEQVALQLTREPRKLPKMKINPEVKSIFDFKYEDFELVDYDPHPHIAGVVAV